MKKLYLSMLLAGVGFGVFLTGFSRQPIYAQEPPPTPEPAETTPVESVVPDTPAPATALESTDPLTPSSESTGSETGVPDVPGEAAASTEPAAEPSTPEDTLAFTVLGFQEEIIKGPSDVTSFRFGLPAHWQLSEGGELHLDFSNVIEYMGLQPAAQDNGTVSGGDIAVSLNKISLATIPLGDIGAQRVVVPLTSAALVSARDDGLHELDLELASAFECGSDLQTNIIVNPDSFFILPHDTAVPPTDLRMLPRPIYQQSFESDVALLVVPNQPTPAEMQAALAVAAGFGKLTSGNLDLLLIPVNQLTAAERDAHHLIFVGDGTNFPVLEDVSLPVPLNETGFDAPESGPEDGLIQMAISPWNETKVILVVSGEDEAGLRKAGQAISVGEFLTSGQPDIALISEIQSDESPGELPAVDQSLADLGYSTKKVQRSGTNWLEFEFEVPPGYWADSDAYLDLTFNHSALLDYERSGLVATLNKHSIASIRFSDDTQNLNTVRLNIPRFAVQTGTNKLTVQVVLEPHVECYNRTLDGLWLTVWPESQLHLPLMPMKDEARAVFKLKDFPQPFEANTTLNNTAFVLAPDNSVAWNAAAQVAFNLGDSVEPVMADFKVIYGDDVPESVHQDHLIVIGRASQIPLLEELSEAAPAPFEAGNDFAVERGMRVQSRIPSDTSLGYLESFPSPWDISRNVLVLAGSTDVGLQWAETVMTASRLRGKLDGNFAIIDNENILIGDVKLELGPDDGLVAQVSAGGSSSIEQLSSEELSTATGPEDDVIDLSDDQPSNESAELSDSSFPSTSNSGRPSWLLPLFATSSVLMVIILGVVLVSSWRQRR